MTAQLRKYPYPYKAMLAICSDLDSTRNKDVYVQSSKFLNTEEQTIMGQGVGLEVGNTIYFDVPEIQFSYWNTDDDGREKIIKLMKAGYVDCIHSFGDLTTERAQIEKDWGEFVKHDCIPSVWVDHAAAPTNFDPDIMKGEGAVPGAKAYHADLTLKDGIKFVWKGRVTSIIAQNAPRSYAGIFNWAHPKESLRTLLLEFVKGMLARLGNKKYRMHAANNVIRDTQLEDGSKVIEFMRTNPSWGGVSCHETADGVSEVITEKFIRVLVKNQGCSVLYTHLAKSATPFEPFNEKTKAAFRLLRKSQDNNEILVATTRRLLGYCLAVRDSRYEVAQENGETNIHLHSDLDESDLQGLTWYTDNPQTTNLFINGKEYQDLQQNPPDESGRASVSIPWKKLIYPDI